MSKPMTPDLRNWTPSASGAKNVDETSMLNTEAHETPDTVQASNTNKEDTNYTPGFGKLGAQGRS